MKTILQIGFGPLGIQTAQYISNKKELKTVAVVDVKKELAGKTLYEINENLTSNVLIFNSVKNALKTLDKKPDLAIITTVSSLKKLIPQIEEVAKFGISVISTCEELSYPWKLQPKLSAQLDEICKKNHISCLGTGVNPGFLMDYLPSVLSSVCKDIDEVIVERVQDATPRRVPFQQKIGAGLNLNEFQEKQKQGTLRHVGLQESVYLLANNIGFNLDNVSETLEPVIADKEVSSSAINVKIGDARGVEQIAYGYINGQQKIKMHFKAAIGEQKSYDKITIKGTPSFSSIIEGGINGDIATCAITINSISPLLKTAPGLHTMDKIGAPTIIN